MKSKHLFSVIFSICLFTGKISHGQAQTPYKLADSYNFDYEVTQVSANKKNAADTNTMHYLYTKSGDYAGLKVSGRRSGKNNLMVFTKDGTSIIFDDDKKTIMIINMKNMIGDFANMAKGMNKDSIASHKGKFDPSKYKAEKTGNTKKVSGYTAEEYKVSDSGKYKASIWYTKVDFNTQLYYLLGMGAGNMMKMGNMGNNPMAGNQMLQTIADPKTLITEITTPESEDGKGMNMYTKSIETISTSVSTQGYKVNDYSNMDMKQMMEQGSKQRGK